MLIYGRLGVLMAEEVDENWNKTVDDLIGSGLDQDKAMRKASSHIFAWSKQKNLRTWNPLLVNYIDLDDKTILEGIMFLGRNHLWIVAARCESIVEKCTVMGIGEALCDTDLGEIE